MTSVIILGFLAGLLFIGGLPHIVSGVLGKPFAMPFGDWNSPAASFVWGWVCWVVAVLLWHAAPMRFHPRAAFVAVAVGALVGGLVMATQRLKVPRRAR